MVRSAYALSKDFSTQQRVALITRLLYTLPPRVMADKKRQWSEELFELARRLPQTDASRGASGEEEVAQPGTAVQEEALRPLPDGFRTQSIATAAARLSLYDADRALELLDSLPSGGGDAPDAQTMAARLVFAIYLQHHGGAGAPRLLASARRWGAHGGFPYAASGAVLAALREDESASESFFREVLDEFRRRQESWYAVRQFAGLLERGVALEAISDESAEEAGRAVVAQLGRRAWHRTGSADAGSDELLLSDRQKQYAAAALNDVRLAAPRAYAKAKEDWPRLTALESRPAASDPVVEWTVDPELKQAFSDLALAKKHGRGRAGRRALREAIERSLRLVNSRYHTGARVEGKDGSGLLPDAQSWALVSLSAYASPMTVGKQLEAIEEPYWRAYFLAIAAQQVGQPAQVPDPTARRPPETEQAAAAEEETDAAEAEAAEADDGNATETVPEAAPDTDTQAPASTAEP